MVCCITKKSTCETYNMDLWTPDIVVCQSWIFVTSDAISLMLKVTLNAGVSMIKAISVCYRKNVVHHCHVN